jgi:hypothetical protein
MKNKNENKKKETKFLTRLILIRRATFFIIINLY